MSDDSKGPTHLPIFRPKIRAECVDGPRPCPWVGCRHNIFLEVLPNGELSMSYEDFDQVPPDNLLCSLDYADLGLTLEEVALLLNVSRERIRQLEVRAKQSSKRRIEHTYDSREFKYMEVQTVDPFEGSIE